MSNRVAIPFIQSGSERPQVWQMTDSYEDFVERAKKTFTGTEFWVFESMDHYVPVEATYRRVEKFADEDSTLASQQE